MRGLTTEISSELVCPHGSEIHMNVITKRNIGRILMTLMTASLWSSARAIPADGNDNTGNLHGNVQINVGGVRLRDVGPIVVFLERIDKENVF